jgi:hypothetical protein
VYLIDLAAEKGSSEGNPEEPFCQRSAGAASIGGRAI